MEVFSYASHQRSISTRFSQAPASVKQAQPCTEIRLSPSYFPAEHPPQSCMLGDF